VNPLSTRPKILVVDDEPNIVLAVAFLLQREGFEVRTAADGLQAIEVAMSFLPDIILLDVMMPEMDGFEAAAKMRRIPALMDTKIIFLTAKGTQKDKETGYAKGAEYYIVKPFDNDVLVSTVHEILVFG
jgi:two-component system, OmpR family, alkaline phosphatase synthesis response regulator PhoP